MSARTGLKSMSVNQLQDNTPTLRKNTPLIGQSRSPLKVSLRVFNCSHYVIIVSLQSLILEYQCSMKSLNVM